MKRNINDLEKLSISDIQSILSRASEFKKIVKGANKVEVLNLKEILCGSKIALCFFENSTRTKMSFEVAAKNLGADTFNLDVQTSSVTKGETLIDTLKVLERYQMDSFIVRHNQSGIINYIDSYFDLPIVNAGDGTHSHPSQALLDLFTLREKFDDLSKVTLTIVGDIIHSRVAKSNLILLNKFGIKTHVFSPATLFPYYLEWSSKIHYMNNWGQVLEESNVIMLLRMQKERMASGYISTESEYHRYFGVNNEILRLVQESGIFLMHPGPVNYGIEILNSANSYQNNLILEQVENGIYVRMAILEYLLSE